MAQNILVEAYVRDAQIFLNALDKNKRNISALYWFYSDGHQSWRLMISSPIFDEMMKSEDEYKRIYDILFDDLYENHLERLQLSDVHLKPTFDPLTQALADFYTVTKGKPIWLDSFVYDSRYIDGVVILRLNFPAKAHHG